MLATWHSALVNLYMGVMLKYRDLGQREHEQHAKYGKQRGTSIYTLLSAKPIIRSVNSKRLWIFLDEIPFRFFLSFLSLQNTRPFFTSTMGNNHSASKSKAIDKQIKKDQKRLNREVKILLLGNYSSFVAYNISLSTIYYTILGAGDSGKSTVLKQMRLIHASGFSAAEREAFRMVIFGNIVAAMQSLLESMTEMQLTLRNQANWVTCIRVGVIL